MGKIYCFVYVFRDFFTSLAKALRFYCFGSRRLQPAFFLKESQAKACGYQYF